MIKKYLLPLIILVLIYGFWISPEFKETAAGIALFLFGMLCLEQGFQAFTGGTLETILRNSTSRSWKSFTFGAVATTLMQSSHLVTLVSISFVSAELIQRQRIQTRLATSVMNDEAYVRDLGAKLISATQALLVRTEHRNEQGIAFTEDEIEALIGKESSV